MSAQAAVPGVGDFRTDPLFPRIERAVASMLAKGKVVTAVDMLVTMQLLAPDKLEDWRRGRVPYLEQVTDCNLTRLSRLLRILRFHAHVYSSCRRKPFTTATARVRSRRCGSPRRRCES